MADMVGIEQYSEAELKEIAKKFRKYQKKNREKSAQMREKKRSAGLVQVNVWVPNYCADFVRQIVAHVAKNPINEYTLGERERGSDAMFTRVLVHK